jgi:hypothetical protein
MLAYGWLRKWGGEKMGRHVHFKNGKFNLWSTVIDRYELSEWVDEETIIQAFVEIAVDRAKDNAKHQIQMAKKHGCSALLPIRCSRNEL